MKTTNENYEKAKALLRANKDLVLLKYYNTYSKSRTLKVYYTTYLRTAVTEEVQTAHTAKVTELHNGLVALASSWNETISTRGPQGFIFRFAK